MSNNNTDNINMTHNEIDSNMIQPIELLTPIEPIEMNMQSVSIHSDEKTVDVPPQPVAQKTQNTQDTKTPVVSETPSVVVEKPAASAPVQSSVAVAATAAPITAPNDSLNLPSNTSGCYITFDIANEGSLYLHWSQTPIPGALAFFSPKKTIPAFKFKQNGGKSEFRRGLRGGVGSGLKRYYEGWVQYLKLAKENMAVIYVQNIDDAGLYYINKDSVVTQIPNRTSLDSAEMCAVASVSAGDTCFDGICSVNREYFVGIGNRQGAALVL